MLKGQVQGKGAGEVELSAGRLPARGLPAGCPGAAVGLRAYPQPCGGIGDRGLCEADLLHGEQDPGCGMSGMGSGFLSSGKAWRECLVQPRTAAAPQKVKTVLSSMLLACWYLSDRGLCEAAACMASRAGLQLGFRVQGLGFGVWGLGLSCHYLCVAPKHDMRTHPNCATTWIKISVQAAAAAHIVARASGSLAADAPQGMP